MRNRVQCVLVVVLAGVFHLSSTVDSQAGSVCFSIHGQGLDILGKLYYTPTTVSGFGGSLWQLTGIDGTFADTVSGVSGVISGLVPGSTYTTIPSTGHHDSFAATGIPFPPITSYDNLLYPNADSPVDCLPYYDYKGGVFDIYGVLFNVSLTGGGTWMVNFWCNGDLNHPGNPIGLDYGAAVGLLGMDGGGNPEFHVSRYLGNGADYQSDPTAYTGSGIILNVCPEPSSLILVGLGSLFMGLIGLRRRKCQQEFPTD